MPRAATACPGRRASRWTAQGTAGADGQNLSFRTTGGDPDRPATFKVNGHVTSGRFDDPLLSDPLIKDMQAEVHCDNGGFQIRNLTARQGQTTWELEPLRALWLRGEQPFKLVGRGRQVRLENVGQRAVGAVEDHWENYDPEGDMDLECTLESTREEVEPTLDVKCLNNVSFSCHKFPYRLDRTRGRLTVRDGVLDLSLIAYASSSRSRSTARFWNPGAQYAGWLELAGRKNLVERKAVRRLAQEAKGTRICARSIRATGHVRFLHAFHRDDPTCARSSVSRVHHRSLRGHL